MSFIPIKGILYTNEDYDIKNTIDINNEIAVDELLLKDSLNSLDVFNDQINNSESAVPYIRNL